MWKQKQVVGFSVNNDKDSLWSQVKVIYNASKKDFELSLWIKALKYFVTAMTVCFGKII